jgi:hypothetical protein
MAKVIARKSDAHKSESISLSFTKDSATGLYKKVEQKVKYSHLDHITKKLGKPIVDENLYELSDESDYDHTFELTTPSGKPYIMYLKKTDQKIQQ